MFGIRSGVSETIGSANYRLVFEPIFTIGRPASDGDAFRKRVNTFLTNIFFLNRLDLVVSVQTLVEMSTMWCPVEVVDDGRVGRGPAPVFDNNQYNLPTRFFGRTKTFGCDYQRQAFSFRGDQKGQAAGPTRNGTHRTVLRRARYCAAENCCFCFDARQADATVDITRFAAAAAAVEDVERRTCVVSVAENSLRVRWPTGVRRRVRNVGRPRSSRRENCAHVVPYCALLSAPVAPDTETVITTVIVDAAGRGMFVDVTPDRPRTEVNHVAPVTTPVGRYASDFQFLPSPPPHDDRDLQAPPTGNARQIEPLNVYVVAA